MLGAQGGQRARRPARQRAPRGRRARNEILAAEDRSHAERAMEAVAAEFGVKWPKAVAKVTDDADSLLTFYDYPAEHWLHLRTTNPIESTFALSAPAPRSPRVQATPRPGWPWSSSCWRPPNSVGARSTVQGSSRWSARGPYSRVASSSSGLRGR